MDIFERPGPQPKLLLNLSRLSKKEGIHLAKVFGVIIGGVCVTLLGVAVNYYTRIGGMFSLLMALFCLSRVFESRNLWKQKIYFTSFEFLKGVSVGSIVLHTLQPVLLAITIAGVLANFVTFSMVSVLTRRREYLYTFAILGSGLIYAVVIGILAMHQDLTWGLDITAFLFLAGFVIYLLIASQCTLERYQRKGKRTQYQHAADIYIDFIGVIIRVVMICVRNRRIQRVSRTLESDDYAKEYAFPSDDDSSKEYASCSSSEDDDGNQDQDDEWRSPTPSSMGSEKNGANTSSASSRRPSPVREPQ